MSDLSNLCDMLRRQYGSDSRKWLTDKETQHLVHVDPKNDGRGVTFVFSSEGLFLEMRDQ